MNGQYAIKGYVYQSLVALLDSFEYDWESICVEPNDESEKVDIRWNYSDGRIMVVQVKSSKNLFHLSAIKKWSEELKNSTPNANEYKLVLIGNIAENVGSKIDNIIIENKNMSIDDFQSIIMQKINSFYEDNGKTIISAKLCKLFAKALNHIILENSVSGKIVQKDEFKKYLLDSFCAIEDQLKKSPFSLILPDNPKQNEDIQSTIMINILKLFGWRNMTKDENQSLYNEKLGKDVSYSLDYWADYESPLKNNSKDLLYINSNFDIDYSQDIHAEIKEGLFCFDIVRDKLLKQKKIAVDGSYEYYVNFILSLADNDQGQTIINGSSLFKGNLLNKNVTYYLIDNAKLNFLISSIITAKNYRPSMPVKFLYPITEDNSDTQKIGKRGIYMPPQFLNSSILPIIKEDKNKISVLLFCSDKFNREHLKKMIWLSLRLTSGLANEYILYFPDYDSDKQGVVAEVVRSYNNNDLNLKVERISNLNVDSLRLIPADCTETFIDESYNENRNKCLNIKPHLIEYLPYGDSMKPFLASEAVKSIDLKAFLSNKGIFLKSADKTRIIQLMTSMLFSSVDIDSLVNFVNINEKPLSTTSKQYKMFDDVNYKNVISQTINNIYPHNFQCNLKAKVVSSEIIQNSDGSVTIKTYLEETNPNKQALVNVTSSISQVTISIDSRTKKLEFTKEYNSRPARVYSDRIVDGITKQLIQNNVIEDKADEVLFSSFSNLERANYLLSFTNINSSNIFINFNAKSIKYMFDESVTLPQEYEDKKGKECITQLKGKNLDSIRELQDTTLKSIILCEEISINYRFKIRDINGNYFVVINFSDALKNKPNPDGIFIYSPKCYINNNCKEKVKNIQSIEKELKIEFNRLVKENLRIFNKI